MPSPSLHAHLRPQTQSLAGERPVNPLGPIDQLTQWLTHAVLQVGLGFTLGLLAAPIMRRQHLHWSWAATPLVPLALAPDALPGLTPTLVTAALTAALQGRRWHHEDQEAGGDLADSAASRLTPLHILHSALRRLIQVDLDELRMSAKQTPSEPIVGEDQHARPIRIPLQDSSGGMHTLVVGSTGSGKTVTQTALAVAATQRDMGVIVLDPKGDRAMRRELERAARIAGVSFIEWTPEGPTIYNPFAHGTPTEIADRALAGERFTEPHYLRQAQRYLGHEVRILRGSGRQVSLAELADHLDPMRLEVLARTLPTEDDAAHDYLRSLTTRQLSELAGIRDRLAIIAESDIAPWLDPRTPNALKFDLPGALRERAVVYFALRSDQRPLLAQMLGAAIVQDLQSAVAGLQANPVPSLVTIDEFSALGAEHVWRLFGRARSAGISLLLGTQELSDLRLAGNERLLEQILGNLSTLIAHRQVVPDSAELLARLAGTRGAWSVTFSSTGNRTRRRVRENLLAPERITRLRPGYAAVLTLTGSNKQPTEASIVRMHPPQQ